MIGEIRYFNNVEDYAKQNKIQDFVLTYYIENMGNARIGEEKTLVQYINRVRNKSIRFSIRKEEGCWFEVYYTGILESKKTVCGLADILSINNLFKEFVDEIKRIEYDSYSKLSDDIGRLKLDIKPFIQGPKFNLEGKESLNRAYETILKLAYELDLNNDKDIRFSLFDKHVSLISHKDGSYESILIKLPQNNRGIEEIRISIDNDGVVSVQI